MPPPHRTSSRDPRTYERPSELMAVVHTTGDPNEVAKIAIGALYGAVYTLKFALKKAGDSTFKVQPLRARWANIGPEQRDSMHGTWGIPVPDGTTDVVQKVPGVVVKLERWEYGTVAEILHIGPYNDEPPTVDRLRAFIADQGYETVGEHEEEYLTRPDAKTVKTVIRYRVRPVS